MHERQSLVEVVAIDDSGLIKYWRSSAEEDMQVAVELLQKGRLRHGLFFAHLEVEKMLKAHVVKATHDVPPRIHSLVRLAALAGVPLSAAQTAFLRILAPHQIEGRYPDAGTMETDPDTAREKLARAQEMLKWLSQTL